MSELLIPSRSLANLLEQVARRLHSQGHVEDLFPAQWAALRYVQRMPPHLRTSSDLARYQGQEHGSVARTVRTLITKGLLSTEGLAGRGRATALGLTPSGVDLLKLDPLLKVQEVFEHFDEGERETLARLLEQLVRALHDGDQQ